MEARVSAEIEAPAEVVWRIVGNFHGLDRWFPGVEACHRDPDAWGEVRLASLGGRITPERLESYDLERMTCSWSLVEVPLLGRHRSTLTVSPRGPKSCRVDWVFVADPQPPLDAERIRENTERLYGDALGAVRDTVEKMSA